MEDSNFTVNTTPGTPALDPNGFPASSGYVEANAPDADGFPIPQVIHTTPPRTMTEQMADFKKNSRIQNGLPDGLPNTITPPTAPNDSRPKEIWMGDKRYTTDDVAHLERQASEYTQLKASQVTASAPIVNQVIEDTDDELAEMVFSNPKEYIKKLTEKMDRVADAKIKEKDLITAKQKATADTIKKFYDEHKDLKGKEDIVMSVAQKIAGDLANAPDSVASSRLAQAARARLAELREPVGTTEVVGSKTAVTAGAMGNPVARAASEPQGQTDFVTQMKQAQRKGKTRY